MSQPHAVIIAGGKGERLGGVRKADLRLGGRRLVDLVAVAIGKVATPLMISTGPIDDGRGARSDSVPVVDGAGPVGGPLAGVAAAVAQLHARGINQGLLVSVAVDTPLLPSDFVQRLMDGLGDGPAAFAAWGEQFYPPNAIWQIEALGELPRQVAENRAPRSLKALLQSIGGVRIDWRESHGANPFINVNTVTDLMALERMAQKLGLDAVIHNSGNWGLGKANQVR